MVCGTKSQDYAIECYCCGNYYCSDKCKVQDHQKKLFHRHTWMDYRKIFEGIMSIDPNIRFVTIFDINGKISTLIIDRARRICSPQKRVKNLSS